ncbi:MULTISPECIES: EAL domain-containing protein [unclassified Brevundimonas]|uniref:EAL domain-containing protein n=1 Tax=unclassified Brevundimonas TaxID=2622653 RepID=UPI0025BEBACB|nr:MULTISPECIES: EAL domain-containing protein [unclassified Brevundimonas]
MSLAPRLLGLAFSAADSLIELDAKGVVRFALGAGPSASMPIASWVGRELTDLLTPETAAEVRANLGALKPGHRSTPLAIHIPCGQGVVRQASLFAFKLPELAPAVSCSLTYTDRLAAPQQAAAPASEITDAQELLADLRQTLSQKSGTELERMSLSFVDVSGINAIPSDKQASLYAGIFSVLKSNSIDGSSAGRISDSRYALVRDNDNGRDIEAEIRAVGEEAGIPLCASSQQNSLGTDAAAALRAMRFAIEACLRDEGLEHPAANFANTLDRTLKDAERFRSIVRDRNFSLHYQPIVDLKTRSIHHYEALTRFPNSAGPAPAIRMAEELALIEGFDRSVAEMAIHRLRTLGQGQLRVAINVSGASLSSDDYVTALLAMTASAPEVRSRLMVEVTETAALAEIASANRRLNALREVGIKICIDDFGVGSASFDYLRGLNADIVKIDGSLIRDIGLETRNRTLISHLVDLGNSLGLETVGEMVETEEQARILASLGVNYAQGWLFGRAEAEPRTSLGAPVVARRKGVTESWG